MSSTTRPPTHLDGDPSAHAARVRTFEAILSAVRDYVYVFDREGRFTFANQALLDLWGLSLAQMKGKTMREVGYPAEVEATMLDGIRQVLATGAPTKNVTHSTDARGKRSFFENLLAPVRSDDGTVEQVAGSSRDITESRQTHLELEALAQQRQLALDAAPMGWWHYDPATRIASWDEGYRRIFGVEGSSRLNDEILAELIHPDDLPGLWAKVEAALDPAAPKPFVAEYRIIRPDGALRWIEAHGMATFDDGDGGRRATSFVGTVADVTERKHFEEELRNRERQLQALIENVASGVALIDSQGHFTLFNKRFLTLFGLASDLEVKNVNDQNWSAWQVLDADGKLLHVDQHPVRRAVLTGQTVRGQLVGVKCPGVEESTWMLVSAAPVFSDGKIERIICTYHDVTALRNAEAAVRAANQRLQETDERKNQFMAVLSHELRNPLAPIRNSIVILERAAPGGEQAKRAIDVIARQTTQLARLVDDLLDVTRVARNKVVLKRRPLDLNAIVRRTVEDHRSLLRSRGLELEEQLTHHALTVDGDESRLAQIVGNLLQNAAKFTPGGGTVTVATALRRTASRAAVTVTDTGVGMPAEVVGRLFQPFMQADTTLDRSQGGLGLGLALVRGLVELHGGEVRAESAGLGQGSTFTVELPLDEGAVNRDEQEAPPPGTGRARVLIIEDNVDAAESLMAVLELEGHQADIALSGAEGVAMARRHPPDVVLCDIGLPGMDGYAVARELRAEPCMRDALIVALSGYALPEDVRKAADAGFHLHLAKPPSIERLKDVLRHAPRSSS